MLGEQVLVEGGTKYRKSRGESLPWGVGAIILQLVPKRQNRSCLDWAQGLEGPSGQFLEQGRVGWNTPHFTCLQRKYVEKMTGAWAGGQAGHSDISLYCQRVTQLQLEFCEVDDIFNASAGSSLECFGKQRMIQTDQSSQTLMCM